MNTKTITYHAVHNYGAVLQSYALQKALISLGFINEIINFNKDKVIIFDKIELKLNRNNLLSILINLLKVLYFFELKRKYLRFENFINNELILTSTYKSYEELKLNPPDADCYISGSDQVWNAINGCFPAFFLDFGNKNTKRISYAASMGVYNLPIDNEKKLINYISKFDKVSLREEEAKNYIEARTDKNCLVHIDPVFLLDKKQWSKLCNENSIKGKYILCYPLINNELLNESLKKLKKLTNLPIIILVPENRTKCKGDIYIRDAGPKEFLSLIKNSEYVVTTSFHGTAFSIIFEKKFFSLVGLHAPTRITNLLNTFNLGNRVITDIEYLNLDEIDYDKVNILKNIECQKSIDYLKNIMKADNG